MTLARTVIALTILMLAGAALTAQTPPPAAAVPTQGSVGSMAPPSGDGVKIAVVNFAQVLEGTDEAQKEIGNVRTFIDDKQREHDTQAAELEQLKTQYTQQQRTLNEETRAEMELTITDKETKLRRFQEDTQREIDVRRNALFKRLTDKLQPVINEYAMKAGYQAIFFLDQVQGYFSPSLNVTQEIIRAYNERYPVAGAGTATATPSATPPR